MKHMALCLGIVLAVFVNDAFAQKVNLVGTTWILKYTTGKVNSNDYVEYARVMFQKGGKVIFNNGETGHWSLKGNKLSVQNDVSDTVLVHYFEVRIKSTTAFGTGVLGMTTTVPYWVRLAKRS